MTEIEYNGGYGPEGREKWILRESLLTFMGSCTNYEYNLSIWGKFILWRYTLGSGSLNKQLIGFSPNKNTQLWVYLTCKFWKNLTFKDREIEGKLSDEKYSSWFETPVDILKLDPDDSLFTSFIDDYAETLKKIIFDGPAVQDDINVIKVSTKYPDLPDPKNFKPTKVLQKPFNSTTLDLELNFGFFLADDTENFVFVLTIPKGSHVLYIAPFLHAYPWEQEVLLPYGCSFDMKEMSEDILYYYKKTEPYLRQIQESPFTLGPVYEVDNIRQRELSEKKVTIMKGTYVSEKTFLKKV